MENENENNFNLVVLTLVQYIEVGMSYKTEKLRDK